MRSYRAVDLGGSPLKVGRQSSILAEAVGDLARGASLRVARAAQLRCSSCKHMLQTVAQFWHPRWNRRASSDVAVKRKQTQQIAGQLPGLNRCVNSHPERLNSPGVHRSITTVTEVRDAGGRVLKRRVEAEGRSRRQRGACRERRSGAEPRRHRKRRRWLRVHKRRSG